MSVYINAVAIDAKVAEDAKDRIDSIIRDGMGDGIFLDEDDDSAVVGISYVNRGKDYGIGSLSPSDFELPPSNDEKIAGGGRLSDWESALADDIDVSPLSLELTLGVVGAGLLLAVLAFFYVKRARHSQRLRVVVATDHMEDDDEDIGGMSREIPRYRDQIGGGGSSSGKIVMTQAKLYDDEDTFCW